MFSRSGAVILSPVVDIYIRRQRSRLERSAKPLVTTDRTALGNYFSSEVLESVRLLVADPLPIPDPPLTNLVRRFGFEFPRPSLTEAITFGHVIVARNCIQGSLLFHELVHAVQFQVLGIRTFAQEYVYGFLRYRDYFSIPLERCAFDLQFRFETGEVFDAETEIYKDLKAHSRFQAR
jgi:hypothetical protein